MGSNSYLTLHMRVLNPTSLTTTQAVEGLGAYALYHLASLDEHMFKQWPYVNRARPRGRELVCCALSTTFGFVLCPWGLVYRP